MSGKLDQSLDEIVSSHRRGAPRGGAKGRRVRTSRQVNKAVSAPVGGVKKTAKPVKGSVKGVPTGPSGGNGESKILISNLPKDVVEQQIKEYFGSTVGPIKRVEMAYGPTGASRGTATIIFVRSDGATKAVEKHNGVLIDGRPIKIDVILDARRAAAIPPPKGLSDRITAPKAQPKSAANVKATGTTGTRGGKGKRGRGGRDGRARPTKKTAEELDSEMVDYWNTGAAPAEGAAAPGGAAPATNGDAPMEDEIL